MASWATNDIAQYSTFVVERAEVGYFLEIQEIAPKPMLDT